MDQALPIHHEASDTILFTLGAAYQALPKMGSKLFDFNRANNLLRLLLEGPTIVDTDVDSRRQLDRHLKVTCEAFIAQAVASLSDGIPALLEKVLNRDM